MTERPTPFALVFASLADERFGAIRDTLGDAPRLDDFLMAAPVVELLRDLRPDEGLGDAVDDFIAFVHAAYRHWASGTPVRILDREATDRLLAAAGTASGPPGDSGSPATEYIQVAPRRIWARLQDQDTHEPLDGWFAVPEGEGLRVAACLGLHPSRPGLSVLVAEGRPSPGTAREGDAPFAATMEGGAAAGLASIANAEELLRLAWHAAAR